jgi:hypothetical protein
MSQRSSVKSLFLHDSPVMCKAMQLAKFVQARLVSPLAGQKWVCTIQWSAVQPTWHGKQANPPALKELKGPRQSGFCQKRSSALTEPLSFDSGLEVDTCHVCICNHSQLPQNLLIVTLCSIRQCLRLRNRGRVCRLLPALTQLGNFVAVQCHTQRLGKLSTNQKWVDTHSAWQQRWCSSYAVNSAGD